MSGLRERVARAIAYRHELADRERWDLPPSPEGERSASHYADLHWRVWLPVADAAIREVLDALAEPTAAMRDVPVLIERDSRVGDGDSFETHLVPSELDRAWRAMLAEARRGLEGEDGRG